MAVPNRMLPERYQPPQTPTDMVSSTSDVRSPKGLIQRVQTLAQNEAREARARRGLPFGGLFGAAEQTAIQQNDVVRILPTENATRGSWTSFFSF